MPSRGVWLRALPAATPRLYGTCVPELGRKDPTAYGPEGETGCRHCPVVAKHQAVRRWAHQLSRKVGLGHRGYCPYREVWREAPTPGHPQGGTEDRGTG